MIVPSKNLKDFINNMFDSQGHFAKEFEIDPATLTRYLRDEVSCSTGFIEKVKSKTGMDFEKAFDIKDD